MKRDIEFRGYDTESKCWRYGYYFCKKDVTLCAIYNSEEEYLKDKKKNEHHLILINGFSDWNLPRPHYQSEVDGDSIGQYTEKNDKNNKRIYEGDIIKESCNGDIGTVIWDNSLGTYKLKEFENYFIKDASIWEVIGNVYENKELLNNK